MLKQNTRRYLMLVMSVLMILTTFPLNLFAEVDEVSNDIPYIDCGGCGGQSAYTGEHTGYTREIGRKHCDNRYHFYCDLITYEDQIMTYSKCAGCNYRTDGKTEYGERIEHVRR